MLASEKTNAARPCTLTASPQLLCFFSYSLLHFICCLAGHMVKRKFAATAICAAGPSTHSLPPDVKPCPAAVLPGALNPGRSRAASLFVH